MAADRITPEGHVRGIVLIDEIEQHLHPSLQAEILPRISEVFPEIQLIATTHSPLVALDARPEELVVLRREGSEVVRQEDVPDYTGYSAEDMLVDKRLIRKYEAEGNAEVARDFQHLLETQFLSDACDYAAAARAVVRDPALFGL